MTTLGVHEEATTPIAEILRAVGAERSSAECIVGPGDFSLDWATFIDRVERVAHLFQNHGLGCTTERSDLAEGTSGQDHLAILSPNTPACLELMAGAFAARVVPININHRFTDDELVDVLSFADVTAIAVDTRFAESVNHVLDRLPNIRLVVEVTDDGMPRIETAIDYERSLDCVTIDAPLPVPSGDDLYILLTGGTTGRPRGVMWRNADAVVECFDAARHPQHVSEFVANIRPELRVLSAAPFMHGAGQWMAFRALLAGGTVVLTDVCDSFNANDTLNTAAHHKATLLGIVGESFARPLIHAIESGAKVPDSVNVVLTGGAPLSQSTKERLLELLPTIIIVDGFGSSETGGQMSIVSTRGNASSGTFRPRQGQTFVVDDSCTQVISESNSEVGWLATCGRLPLGYLNDQVKTEQVFRTIDGVRFAIPGDHARLRYGGSIEALGREAVCINTGGEKVFAEEVEDAVLRHRAVRDCIIVGRPSPTWGSEVVAVISLNHSGVAAPTAEELSRGMPHLARFKHPKCVIVQDEICRSPAGKADYTWARHVAMSVR